MEKKTAFEKWLDNPNTTWTPRRPFIKDTQPLTESIVIVEKQKQLDLYYEFLNSKSSGEYALIDVFPCGTAVTYTDPDGEQNGN